MEVSGRIQSLFATRRSRRRMLAEGAAVTTSIVGPSGARVGSALAADGTPVSTPEFEKVMFLFVQAFESGTWVAMGDGAFRLTLTGGVASTIYFSDRPERVFGSNPTQRFLNQLGFVDTNPPNAAIVVNADGEEDIVVMELFAPVYDAEAGTLTYSAKVLEAWDETGLGSAAARKGDDNDLPDSFGEGALFIDDCADGQLNCVYNGSYAGNAVDVVACCYTYLVDVGCTPCDGQDYTSLCARYVGYECADGGCTAGDIVC